MTNVLLAFGLKAYLGHRATLEWVAALREAAESADPTVEFAVFPAFTALASVVRVLDNSRVRVGAQDVAADDRGDQTGEITAEVLAELGCTYVELGHAERRARHGDTDEVIGAKLLASARAGLTPFLCVGARADAENAAAICAAQVTAATTGYEGPLVVAYEPVAAIGAAVPDPADAVRDVARSIRERTGSPGLRIVYGGAAGVGTLPPLVPDLDGLFLGRFAHDPAVLPTLVSEASALAASITDERRS